MPRNTRTSQASASTQRDPTIVLSGDEDGAVQPRRRLDPEVYERLRDLQRSFALNKMLLCQSSRQIF